MGKHAVLGATLFMALAGFTRNAHGYTISNAFSSGCHENLTAQALRTVRLDTLAAGPLPLVSSDEHALVDDLQFVPDADMRDLGGATILIAVRDNDLKGQGSSDLSSLASIHGSGENQREHCLRRPNEVEPGGTETAVKECHGFIHQRVMEALDGLDASGNVDITKRTPVKLHLSLRGEVTVDLPTFYVKMGQALHTVEDSFTHTYRTPDSTRITVILNWVKSVEGTLNESTDGPPHIAELDRCDDPDDRRKQRRLLAMEATTGILRAAFDTRQSRDGKLATVDAIMEKYLGFQAGCTFANNWCAAPESQYKPAGTCGCRVPVKTGGTNGLVVSSLLLVGVGLLRRTLRRKNATGRAAAAAASLLGGLLLFAGSASAQPPAHDPPKGDASKKAEVPAAEPVRGAVSTPNVDDKGQPLTPAEKAALPPPPVAPVAEPGSHDTKTDFGAYAGFSGSIDKPALAGTLGFRVRTSRHWALGLDGEWNPWIALNGKPVHRGVINIYGTAILRFPLAYENFNLRSTVNLGVSYLLTNLVGAPSGSTGLYFGIAPLGVEWKASRSFYLIINPINIAVPAPQLKGVPLLYPQYRFTIGLEFYSG